MESLSSRATSALVRAQNTEGGWGYLDGGSWTEPTALALLALEGEPLAEGVRTRASEHLRALQGADGGWPPRRSVDHSTWVTALAVLALGQRLSSGALAAAVRWLLRETGKELGFLPRLRMRLLGVGVEQSRGEGWPWFPETAAWVMPTALTILALEKVRSRVPAFDVDKRLGSARQYLWSRMCRDGGWNHGSTRALGYDAASYPEATGIALLALRGERSPRLPMALSAAERHLRDCRSSSGRSWLRLGLSAHARPAPGGTGGEPPWRGVMDLALCLLAERAAAGSSPLVG
jgi:hypothetical protein